MAQFTAVIVAMPSGAGGGPYVYSLFKDGVGLRDVNALANIAAALDGVKADIAANLGAETVKRTTISVQSS